MDVVWLSSGIVLTVLGIVALAVGVKAMHGVPGEVRELKSRVFEMVSKLETVDERITREVKARASAKAVEARQEDRSIELQAAEVLAGARETPHGNRRPSAITGR